MWFFLDRDGVINHDSPNYITRVEDIVFIPGSLDAIARLTETGRRVFIVTNQSAVNRGLLSASTLQEIHRHMTARIEQAGGDIQEIRYCPHRPDEFCVCRKPLPGMILSVIRKYGIDPATAVMIGDRASDIASGRNAGVGLTIKVGDVAFSELDPIPDYVAADLHDAVSWLLSRHDA